jgi:protein-S-isoprenylcysteine O-methyltransferase Ste14
LNIIGKATVNPLLFYTGKIAGFLTWISLFLSYASIIDLRFRKIVMLEYLSYFILAIGLAVSIISMLNLGRSTTVGLPIQKRAFRRSGLYKISRNPMYVGFNLLTLASMIYQLNLIILFLGIYSISVYHLIILGEEKYMEKQYKEEYRDYRKKVRRYI